MICHFTLCSRLLRGTCSFLLFAFSMNVSCIALIASFGRIRYLKDNKSKTLRFLASIVLTFGIFLAALIKSWSAFGKTIKLELKPEGKRLRMAPISLVFNLCWTRSGLPGGLLFNLEGYFCSF